MGRIVELPVAAPSDFYVEATSNLFADEAKNVPFLAVKFPELAEMDDIDGEAKVVGGLPPLSLAVASVVHSVLGGFVPVIRMREHGPPTTLAFLKERQRETQEVDIGLILIGLA